MMTERKNINLPFWLFLVGYFLIVISPSFLTEGMFLDGVTYSEISSNMAEGKGSFWQPYMNHILYSEFREHPPLALGISSLFYRMFGDSVMVDKIYSVFSIMLAALLVVAIWKRSAKSPQMSWFPLLLWSLLPLVIWSATNNLLENTMSFFVLASVYLAIVGIQKDGNIMFVLSGISLFLAFLTKGFTGLFPLIFVIIYDLIYRERKIRQTVKSLLLVILGLFASCVITYVLFPVFCDYMIGYFNRQVVGSIANVVTVSSRFYIMESLLVEILMPLAFLVIISIMHKSVGKIFFISNKKDEDFKWFLVFLSLGLSGVLPIMVSMKQSGFYMLTALPFFALALAHLFRKTMESLLSVVTKKIYVLTSCLSVMALVIGIVLNLVFANTYGRDEAFLRDMKAVLNEIGDDKTVSITEKEYPLWSWHSYFARYGDVGLDDKGCHDYLLLSNPEHLSEFGLQDKYEPAGIKTECMFLYKKR